MWFIRFLAIVFGATLIQFGVEFGPGWLAVIGFVLIAAGFFAQ